MSPQRMMLVAFCVVMFGSYMMFVTSVMKKNDTKSKLKDIARYNKKYERYYENFFTRKVFRRLAEDIAVLHMYTKLEARIRAVKTYERTMLLTGVTFLVGVVTLRDLTSILCLCVFIFVMRDILIHKKIESSKNDLKFAFSKALASLRDYYTRCGDIAESVENCERDEVLNSTFEDIYNILTETKGEELLDDFYDSTPFPKLRTLASTCYLLANYGDGGTLLGNLPAFKQSVMMLKEEQDIEIRQIIKRKLLFGKLEYLPIVPIFFIGIIQSLFLSMIPGTSVLYRGVYGYIVRTIIIGASAYGYHFIANVGRTDYARTDDRVESIDNLLSHNWFRKLVNDIKPHKYKDVYMWEQKLKGCLSNKDVEYIYASKIVYVALTFFASLVLSIVMVVSTRNFLYNNINMTSLTQSQKYTKEQEIKMRNYDHYILSLSELPDDQQIRDSVEQILPFAEEQDLDDQVERITDKYHSYSKAYYHWWFLLIVAVLSAAAWFMPEQVLKSRKKHVMEEAEEDVLQMQTVILILSTTTLDTQELIYWLSKNSSIHKEHLYYAYFEYSSDAEIAIARLKDNSIVPEFKQICDKMELTISQISLKEAFEDLLPEREHLLKIRDMTQEQALISKRGKASSKALAPIYLLLLGMLVGPMLILGLSQFAQIMGQIQ